MKNEQVRLYYERWADNEHGNFVGRGREEFYKFVKAVLALDKHPTTEFLKLALYDSFANLRVSNEEAYDELVYQAAVLFETLRDYSNLSFE